MFDTIRKFNLLEETVEKKGDKKVNTLKEVEYNFKMTNRTILKLEEKYKNGSEVINGILTAAQVVDGIMNGDDNVYNNSLKLISCCCVERDFTIDELLDRLDPIQMLSGGSNNVVTLAINLIVDYIGSSKKNNEENEKN